MSRRLSIAILLLIAAIIVIYVVWNWEDFGRIKSVEKRFFCHQTVLVGLTFCIGGYIIRTFVALFGIRLRPSEWFGLAVLTSLGNYLTPFRGGTALKGVYLKKRLRFPYSTFISTVAASYILSFLSAGTLGIIVLLLVLRLYGTIEWKLFAFFSSVSAIMIGTLVFSPTIRDPQNTLTRAIRSALNGWSRIRRDKTLVTKITALLILKYITTCARFYYSYRMIHIEFGVLPSFLMSLVAEFFILIAITPGSLGIQEAAIGFISRIMHTGFDEGFMVAGILRVVDTITIFTLGPIFAHVLLNKPVDNGDQVN